MYINRLITLECTGAGAVTFLQGQLTCNINELQENIPQLTACCNLQGRVIFTAFIIKNEEKYCLIIPISMKEIVMNHLEKYARFSKCCITEVRSSFEILRDVRTIKTHITNGIPTIYPETSEKIIPQRLNLHLIPGAMSFKKGCYLGQEIIARLHFKGQLKHHMYLGEIEKAPINYGADITDVQQKVTGMVIDFHIENNKALLLFVNEIGNKTPYLNQQKITLIPLPYSIEEKSA